MPDQIKLSILNMVDTISKEYKKRIDVELKKDVEVLKKSILKSESFSKIDPNENALKCDLIFRGYILQSGKPLTSCGIRPESTLQVVIKKVPVISQPKSVSAAEIQDIFTGLQKLMRGGHTAKFAELVTNRSRLESLIQASPALGRDLFAYSLIQDVSILAPILSDKDNVCRTLQAHPCLAKATLYAIRTIVEEVKQEAANPSFNVSSANPVIESNSGSAPVTRTTSSPHGAVQSRANLIGARQQSGSPSLYTQDFSVDQNLAEDSDDEEMDEGGGQGAAGGAANRQQNTINQLLSSMQSANRTPITADFLRSAMENAISPGTSSGITRPPGPGTTPSAAGGVQQSPLEKWKVQLDQLREMGVSDSMTAIQALEATNGDIEAAINIIFS